MRYRVAIPSTREGSSPTPVRLDSVPPDMRAYESKKMEFCLQIQQIISIL